MAVKVSSKENNIYVTADLIAAPAPALFRQRGCRPQTAGDLKLRRDKCSVSLKDMNT